MMPSAIYEILAADSTLAGLLGTGQRIFELQSVDERPVDSGYFIIVDFQETVIGFQDAEKVVTGEQTVQIWVHTPLDVEREYNTINRILNRIDALLLPIEQVTGTDGVRVAAVKAHSRSRNTFDPGWKTTTRFGLYGVLYDQSAA